MNEAIDRWIQRAAVAAMVALAFGLLVLGVALYAPTPQGRPATMMVR